MTCVTRLSVTVVFFSFAVKHSFILKKLYIKKLPKNVKFCCGEDEGFHSLLQSFGKKYLTCWEKCL